MSSSARQHSDSSDARPLARPLHFEFSDSTAKNYFLKVAMTGTKTDLCLYVLQSVTNGKQSVSLRGIQRT
jgi:hypothetical protein